MDVAAAIADAHRREWAGVLAATVRVAQDLDLAEECVQEAYARALVSWTADGIPTRPGAWLTTVARRCALDALRRETVLQRRLPLLIVDAAGTNGADVPSANGHFPDDRLRLVFTCCHPALSVEAQVALTLRLVCGLTTVEVARAFLVSEATMAARITRAKKKIAAARIPYRVPTSDDLPARLHAVLDVVHLVFTTGHTAPAGTELMRRDLVLRAIDIARMVRSMLPAQPGVAGLLALFLLTDARRDARSDEKGRLLLLKDQDRGKWDQDAIAQGRALVREALRVRPPDRFTVMAAIAAVHADAPTWLDTRWGEIVGLYDVLATIWPSPVVELNRAVAIGFSSGPAAGLDALDRLADEPALARYPYLSAARAHFLRELGRMADARTAYEEALLLTENTVEAGFLRARLNSLPG